MLLGQIKGLRLSWTNSQLYGSASMPKAKVLILIVDGLVSTVASNSVRILAAAFDVHSAIAKSISGRAHFLCCLVSRCAESTSDVQTADTVEQLMSTDRARCRPGHCSCDQLF